MWSVCMPGFNLPKGLKNSDNSQIHFLLKLTNKQEYIQRRNNPIFSNNKWLCILKRRLARLLEVRRD